MEKDKSLKSKAVDLKGKKYVLVADRVLFFNEEYPDGMIETSILSPLDADRVIMQAKVTPDANKPSRCYIGHSQASWSEGYVNKTSAIENCETSAVGRALALMGIGVIESIASADEMKKAGVGSTPTAPKPYVVPTTPKTWKATPTPEIPLTPNGAPKF